MQTPRYLLSFDTRNLPVEGSGVLIVGAGIAGLSCALTLAKAGMSSTILSKSELDISNTAWAQGGIAYSSAKRSNAIDEHVRDTIAAGDGLCHEDIVQQVISGGDRAMELLQKAGCHFDADEKGDLRLGVEAAHSEARIVHAGGDETGAEVARGLIQAARSSEKIFLREMVFVVDLLSVEDQCIGALVLESGRLKVYRAGTTVLASGGCGKIYRESSNSPIATGDGHAMALRAGVTLRDLELVQFHPTLFYVSGAPRLLVTEAVRGAGGLLRNVQGDRFVLKHDERGELAPRDVVSRAISQELRESGEAAVFLDVTSIDKQELNAHFPHFAKLCATYGIDTEQSWVPVRPGPHYMVGGVKVDALGRSSLRGLRAIGEAASSGLHGANRLASNSLLEGAVMGEVVGESIVEDPLALNESHVSYKRKGRSIELDLEDLRSTFRTLMLRFLGVERHGEEMRNLRRRISHWQWLIENTELTTPYGLELANMLHLGGPMTDSALARVESRGVHWRSDYPHRLDEWDGLHVEYDCKRGAYRHDQRPA